jgi:hypothetical protein
LVTFFFSFLHFISFHFFLHSSNFVRSLHYRSSFLVRSFFVPIWVLVSIVRSIIRCFLHILPAFLLLLLLSPVLLSSYYSFVILPLFLYTAVGCVLVRVRVLVRDSFHFVTVCGPTVTSSQSAYHHLIVPFQLLSVILPTRVLLSLFHCILPLICWLPVISVLIHPLKSSRGYFSSFGIDSSRTRFASSSASSFPVIPACLGTQHSVTFPFRLSMSCLIFLVFGFFLWLFPDAVILIMVLSESVNMTPLTPVVGSFCIALMMACWSLLKIDDWSLILLRVNC